MKIKANVKDKIFRSTTEVFQAIVDKEKITKYFVSGSSGNMVQGRVIIWTFADYGVEIEVAVLRIEENKQISFKWSAAGGTLKTVNIILKSPDKNLTYIEISEGDFDIGQEDVKKAMQQTQGWTDFICSLKAYLYTGINLRTGKNNE